MFVCFAVVYLLHEQHKTHQHQPRRSNHDKGTGTTGDDAAKDQDGNGTGSKTTQNRGEIMKYELGALDLEVMERVKNLQPGQRVPANGYHLIALFGVGNGGVQEEVENNPDAFFGVSMDMDGNLTAVFNQAGKTNTQTGGIR